MGRPVPRHARCRLLRGSLATVSLGLLAGCGVVPLPWQQPAKVPRIGCLVAGTSTSFAASLEAFRVRSVVEMALDDEGDQVLTAECGQAALDPLAGSVRTSFCWT
jgi:hypothetical protein